VRIPVPCVSLVAENAIVESFEEGRSVSFFIAQPSSLNSTIVSKGVNVYLRMLMVDAFVHSDLHPGNILVSHKDDKLSMVLLDCGLAVALSREVRRIHSQELWT
jgi:aarF domain-containing kinase